MSADAVPGSASPAMSAENRLTMVPPAPAEAACAHFRGRLAYEAGPADVARNLADGTAGFALADCRPTGNYLKAHLPGAVSLPWPEITDATGMQVEFGVLGPLLVRRGAARLPVPPGKQRALLAANQVAVHPLRERLVQLLMTAL
jgi:hypothetical protein